ncbi:hypothetical protein N7448_007410 [Penicillium atrosanguineum]|uniref:Rhodopsin domain-containing protein n=1 Tax=Penicillium atrosanguineum TaxID=1132637 RepID=A0A9W9KX07_9EURO|nr:uncharacterized protein N7443_001564 [Penicillium atrosanguineum]KAJ5126631.1 hypothetical protein N7448_007410 [Penicillium atrosanguineum]KAJ5146835.1 hypothetical protein N7526_000187 [Penicillium atrosanguineum]KAJ5314680.1 hypothetical protein N7443_001564 [Penicillium atrosanguineum]KAJ5331850.1 hypothetical protein N7476_001633 [Penicillium atrosanguineum]
MSGLGGDFGVRFARETWALYAVGLLGGVLRFTARIRRLGIRGLQQDDYIMMFGLVWYTILCVALNEVASGGGSNLMTDEEKLHVTPAIHAERERGSKWVFVSEHAFILCVWSCKACMLVIYARITEGLKQRKWINWIAIYVAVGFVVTELSLFLICRPLNQYWAVPTDNYQCSSYQYYEIVQGCLSISADFFMLLVAIPMLIQVRVPLKQKLILVLLFGMGIFVIVAAVLNKVYCLVPSLISYVYMNWYFREATVAILVTNLPLVWSLLRDVFPALKSWTGGSKRGTDRYKSGPWTSKGTGSRPYGPSSQLRSGDFDMQNFPGNATVTESKGGPAVSDISLNASEERDMSSDDGSARALRIRQDITVTVQHDNRPPEYQASTAHAVSRHEDV